MAVPYTLDDTLRTHDKAVHDFFGTCPVDYGTVAGTARNGFPILRIFAAPDNAFATVTDLLVHLGWIAGSTAAQMRENAEANWPVLPLPVLTLERSMPVMDAEQQGNAKTFRRIQLDLATGKTLYHQWPTHMATTYRATLWSIKKYTASWFSEWLYMQLGTVGMGQREMLLPVAHPEPWNVMGQRFCLEGSTDLSTLEGTGRRYIRHEFEFTLRTLVFRPPTEGGSLVYNTGVDPTLVSAENGGYTETPVPYEDTTLELSDNLFFWVVPTASVPTSWPVGGMATVSETRWPNGQGNRPVHRVLNCTVTEPTDTVELAERFNVLDTDPLPKVIVGVSFQYQSLVGAALTGSSHNLTSGAITPAFSRALPPSGAGLWTNVHQFFLARQSASIVDIAGAGSLATVSLRDIDIRQVYDGTRTLFQSLAVNVGGLDIYQWANLAVGAYLVVGTLTTSGTVSGTVTCNDDPVSPDWSPTQSANPADNVGFVFLIQPIAGALSLTVPTGMALDTLYVLPYHGPYNGNSV